MKPQDPDMPVPPQAAPDSATAPAAQDAAVTAEPRRRAPRKKAVVPAAAEPHGDAGAGAETPAPPEPAPEPAVPATAAAQSTPSAASPGDASNPQAASLPQPQSLAGDAPDEAGGQGRQGPRRSRNRRRGRRGGEAARDTADPGMDEGADTALPAASAQVRVHLPQPEVGEVFAHVLSGEFDAEPAPADDEAVVSAPAKRVLAAEPDAPKLQKVLAQAGIGSRRDMEQLVQEGRITVNGEPAHVGQRISFGDQLRIDGKVIKARIAPPPPRVLAYHKPAGEVVTHDDPQHRPTVFRRLPRLAQGKWQSVGRLDMNTEGLLLFTNSGELANQLMHPRFGVEREYAVRVLGVVDAAERERLLQGVQIDGQAAAFKSIEDGGGEGANRWYRVVITEGRNREVRKLFEAVGHAVSRLIRVRYGSVVLPRGLRRGLWVDLDEVDVWALRRMAKPNARPPGHGAEAREDGDAQPRADGERRGRRGGRKGRNDRRRDGPDRPPRIDGAEAAPPVERAPRVDRAHRPQRPDRPERGEGGPIPNPLQQTFDKRAIQQARAQREINEDGPIPNPLQQTFDKRAIQQERTRRVEVSEDGPIPNPLQQTYDKRFMQKAPGANFGRGGAGGRKKGGAAPRQPDPMQTAVGYIGADAFTRKAAGRGGRPGGARGKSGRGGRGGAGGGR
jgi:23S rRNA pseudouridine2605 synthase